MGSAFQLTHFGCDVAAVRATKGVSSPPVETPIPWALPH
jgi:hypothetical protein